MKQVRLENMRAECDAMASRFASAAIPLGPLAPIIREGFAGNFSRAAGSDGTAWPPRKVEGDGHPLLIETGALLEATQGGAGGVLRVDERTLMIGVDKSVRLGGIPGAAVHNFGYPPRNIPQREYLYASEDTLDKCLVPIADAATESIFVF